MSLRILWTETAREELRERMAFVARRSQQAATRLFDRILDSVVPASEHPFIFREGRVAGTREIVAHPNYIVVYRVIHDAIVVVQVLHAREEYPPLKSK
ncbi:type II toxin-antitoxin system RelE/ParE family toxin [Caballeronia sp. GaOx3]|uniref:type II toxin-antitoxin system RelE/ParE family toxin n=1 Tax=Caballeronia sp. GaOx3 TaxID=2921740 RepID=UPI0020295460|nr:type II toxin-antitoxin system RelE/ParE family toxin [Caballeronia sp. GaOx3]